MSIQVTQPKPPNEPIGAEVIATAITEIATAMKAIDSTRLSRKALIVLIQDQSKLSKKTIEIVLNNLTDLENDWLKPKK